jgi:hypothetical protein
MDATSICQSTNLNFMKIKPINKPQAP